MKFTNEFVAGTLQEATEIAATRISQNFALTQLAENGVVTLEETQNMYDLSIQLLTEGSADLIPENLILESDDATDDIDPTASQDAGVDADVDADEMGGAEDEDLNVDDLEGIVLPDSDGNQYIIQGGILVPYEEDGSDDAAMPAGDTPNDDMDGDVDPTTKPEDDEGITESTTVEQNVAPIEESSVFASNSSIIADLLKNTQFSK